MNNPKLIISGSTVKAWFQYRCERKTRYETMPTIERNSIPISFTSRENSWTNFGNEYEKLLVDYLATTTAVLQPSPGEFSLSERLSNSFIEGKRSEEFAFQLVLEATPYINRLFDLTDDVMIKRSIPDLVRIERTNNSLVFSVIDIKAVQHATTFHKAQVAFYSLMLKSTLKHLNLPHLVSDIGHIWFLPKSTGDISNYRVENFNLLPYERMVTDFFRNNVKEIKNKIVKPGVDETFFHIYFKCEQCDYLPHCQDSISDTIPPETRDISAIPGVSHESKRSLHRLRMKTVGDVAEFLENKSKSDLESWSLKRRSDILSVRAKALVSDEVGRLPDIATYLMPPKVDVGLYLVLDVDPVENNIATIGYLHSENGVNRFEVEVLQDGSPENESHALIRVLGKLIEDLTAIDQHNALFAEFPERQKQAHIFMYEPSEGVGLQEAIARHLDNPFVRSGLLHLVRMFPPDDVVPEPEFRGVHHLPATALRSVMEQLFALPIMVSYDLRQVTEALTKTSRGFSLPYCPEERFQHQFSSRLSVDVCRQLRDGKFDKRLIENDVKERLSAIQALVDWLTIENEEAKQLEEGRAFLRLSKKPFRFQESFDPLNAADLDILRAFELLEDRAGLLNTLITLAQPYAIRRDGTRCIAKMRLKRTGTGKWGSNWMFFTIPPESRDNELNSSQFDLILTNDDPDIRLNPQLWPLFEASIAPPRPGDSGDGLLVKIRTNIYNGDDFQRLLRTTPEDGWFLDQTYKNFTANRASDFLRYLGEN